MMSGQQLSSGLIAGGPAESTSTPSSAVPNSASTPSSNSGPGTTTVQHNEICCLVDDGVRCTQPAGNASYSKRIQKQVAQRKLNLQIENSARHIYICDYHKNLIQSIRSSGQNATPSSQGIGGGPSGSSGPSAGPGGASGSGIVKRKRKDNDDSLDDQNGYTMWDTFNSDASAGHRPEIDVDLYQLQVNTLRRYKRHYRIQTRPGLNKTQLAETLSRHFRTIPVLEKEAITYFIYMVKAGKNKLDQGKIPPVPND